MGKEKHINKVKRQLALGNLLEYTTKCRFLFYVLKKKKKLLEIEIEKINIPVEKIDKRQVSLRMKTHDPSTCDNKPNLTHKIQKCNNRHCCLLKGCDDNTHVAC